MCSISLKSCMTKPKLRRLNLQEEKEYMPCDECPTTKTKGVFFAFVQVREHSRILGDHPSVSFGPPITLSWEVESDEIFSVDMYESVRDLYRRSRQQFLVPAAIRVRCNLWYPWNRFLIVLPHHNIFNMHPVRLNGFLMQGTPSMKSRKPHKQYWIIVAEDLSPRCNYVRRQTNSKRIWRRQWTGWSARRTQLTPARIIKSQMSRHKKQKRSLANHLFENS